MSVVRPEPVPSGATPMTLSILSRCFKGRYRWWIGGLLFLSTVINYIDRQTLSVLGPTSRPSSRWIERRTSR